MKSNTRISLPITPEFMKDGDMKLMAILLYNYDWCRPYTEPKPYKRLSKYDYKKNKKKMIELYGSSSQYWNRQFKKMIDKGFIEDKGDYYNVYNKSKDGKWFSLVDRKHIVKMLESNLTNKHFKAFALINNKSYNLKLDEYFQVKIHLKYIATVLGINETNTSRDLIGDRIEEEGVYGEKPGLLTTLEEDDLISIEIKKERFDNFNNNFYYFKVLQV